MATKNTDGLESVTPVSQTDIASILGGVDIAALIQQQVQQAIQEQQTKQRESPLVFAENRTPPTPEPPKYLKHYRCDISPELQILRRHVDGDGNLSSVMKGKYMKFRRGHFFATTQGEVDQLSWMMAHPKFDPRDADRVVGGNPTIYEDDGRSLTECPHCREPFVAGSNAYKAHLRATHGIM